MESASPSTVRARAQLSAHDYFPEFQRTRELPPFGAGEPSTAVGLVDAGDSVRCVDRRGGRALQRAGLGSYADDIAATLSHGAKRQLEIAMCLATAPKILLLDEPLAGMGFEETERMLVLLNELKTSHAILLVEHDMDAVFRVADRLTVMVNGRVLATGTPSEIRANAEVQDAYLGARLDEGALTER